MDKQVLVQFDKEAYKEYEELQKLVVQGKKAKKKPTYEQLLSSINTAIRNLKANPKHGDLIPRKYISKATINRYGTDKIFRIELVGYWRLLYTMIGDEARIIAFILEFIDHKKYDKVFGYRKK
jgi:aromatic ring-opening dioxygenase LigB subunit